MKTKMCLVHLHINTVLSLYNTFDFVSNIMSIIKRAHNALLAFYDKTINETTCEKDGFFHLFYSFILPNIISYSSLSST